LDKEPERYYDWILWKMRQEDKMTSIDKLTGHYESVKLQHDELDAYIEEEYKKYADDEKIHHLKKRKLALKDELEQIQYQLYELKNES